MKELGLTGIEINEQTGYMRLEMIPGAGLSYRGVRPLYSLYREIWHMYRKRKRQKALLR